MSPAPTSSASPREPVSQRVLAGAIDTLSEVRSSGAGISLHALSVTATATAKMAADCRASIITSSSAHRFLHERDDLCLGGGGQLRQREGDGPQGAVIELRLVAEPERRVPGLELVRTLEEADD